MKMQASQAHFAQVPSAEIQRSSFDRSHGHKTTFDGGWLIPIFVDEALPGDTFNVSMTGFARLATPIFPVMDNMYMDTHFFAVPLRLVWDNFVKQMGEQRNPGDSIDYLTPQMTSPAGGYGEMSLQDFMGIPTKIAGIEHSALPLRAYNLIWREWFRDENLQNSPVVDTDDGPDTVTDYVLLRRGKRHDYFTSALPWPQKGNAVSIPIGSYAPVVNDGTLFFMAENAAGTVNPQQINRIAAGANILNMSFGGGGSAGPLGMYYKSGLRADLSSATAATINQLRQAFQIQRMLERDARGGTRYIELIKSHFGVTSPDARLQRPEYLGGGSSMVNVAPIAQTSATVAGQTAKGSLAAMGTATLHGHGFTKSFTEHCILIGLVSVRCDQTYQQGLERMWSRLTRYDHYWPSLSHIGEQTVLRKEIYSDGVDVDDNTVFGYQERYAEYRYKPSRVSGLFRSNAAAPLDAWHLATKFTAAPLLNSAFIVEDPPIDRVIAVQTEPHFIFDSIFRMRCARPMPVYGVPGMIDHF